MIDQQSLTDLLRSLEACHEAREWAASYSTLAEAWQVCDRGDWMLWLAGRLSGAPESDSRKRLVLATCACARLGLPYVHAGEMRPLKAIETAEQWARSEGGTPKDVRTAAAAAAASDATDAAYTAAVAAAAAAAAAAAVAYTAAYTTAAAAAAAAAWRSKRADVLKQCADLVRQHYPQPPTDERSRP